jgi:hypothetical protein
MGIKELHPRAFRAWVNMRQRCSNPNCPAWKWCGARGIKMCERWSLFANFLQDMGDPPSGLTLGRRNHDKDYDPRNCCWLTDKQQLAHQKRSHMRKLSSIEVRKMRRLFMRGATYSSLAKQFGVGASTCQKAVSKQTYADVK